MEEKWFTDYTWKGESTTCVLLKPISSKVFSLTMKMTINYLVSLGLADITVYPESTGRNRQISAIAYLVNMSTKEFSLIDHWTCQKYLDTHVPIAYPSHIPLYMKDMRGMLTGRTFGL